MITNYAFELRNGAAARNARKRIEKYVEDVPQPMRHFWAKSLCGKGQLCWSFQKGSA